MRSLGKLAAQYRVKPWYGSAWRFAGVLLTLLTTELRTRSSQKNRNIFIVGSRPQPPAWSCAWKHATLTGKRAAFLTISRGEFRIYGLGGVDRGGGLGRGLGVGRGAGATLTTPVIPMEQCAEQK